MSWVRIYVHLVFCTKNREPFLNTLAQRQEVFKHIKKNAQEKEIWLESVNGHNNHVHCLISLGRDQTISKIAQLIKGESSYWINKINLTKSKFTWQDDFWASSVSDSHVGRVKKYIDNQEAHHSKKTFDSEVTELLERGMRIIETQTHPQAENDAKAYSGLRHFSVD